MDAGSTFSISILSPFLSDWQSPNLCKTQFLMRSVTMGSSFMEVDGDINHNSMKLIAPRGACG